MADRLAKAAKAKMKARKTGSLRDFQMPSGRGRSFGSAVSLIDSIVGGSSILKGLAGATTGMHTVRTPRDLLDRERGAAMAVGQVAAPGKVAVPAVAITTKATQLRRALGLGNTPRDVKAARELGEAADIPMLQLKHDARDDIMRLAKDPRGGIEPGGIYKVPATSEHGNFVSNRTAILQDPVTGTMFVAPRVIHADLMRYVNRNMPKYRRPDSGWLQHEVYAPEDLGGGITTPARWMVGPGKGIDTEDATITRAALIQALQKGGALPDVSAAVAATKARRAAMRGGVTAQRAKQAGKMASARDIRDLLDRARKNPPGR